jgi:transposase
VNRDLPAFLPLNMLDWAKKDHVVWLVIDAVEAVATPELIARLVPPVRSAKGRRRYDPVMLLTLLVYSYMRGVLSSRAIEDRCQYDATFRLACGGPVPDHVTIARFRKRACTVDGLMGDLFYAVLAVCAAAGLGRLTVIAGDGVKIGANASKEANRTEAGLEKLTAKIIAAAAAAEAADQAGSAAPAAADLLGGELLPRGWTDPRSRAPRITNCLEQLRSEREAAEAAARAAGQGYLDALAAGTAEGRPPAQVAVAAQQIRVEQAIAARQELIADWEARRAGGEGSRLGRRPVSPDDAAAVRRARARLAELAAAQAQAEAGAAASGPQDGKDKPTAPQRNITDPDSRLLPVRGGGFRQGYNCQDAAADDRLMLGGYPCQDTGDALHAQRLEAAAVRGAAVVTAAHAAHASDPERLAACHDRMCAGPGRREPGHDITACHAAMTGIGTIVFDAGYYSEQNVTAEGPGPDRLIATGKRATMDSDARDSPAEGPPPEDATPAQVNSYRLRTPEGRALYKRRAPDVEGLHASLEDRIRLRRFSLRSLTAVTGEFLLAGLCHNLLLLSRLA